MIDSKQIALLITGLSLVSQLVRATPADSVNTRELARFAEQFDPKTGLSGTVLRYNLHYAALLYERGADADRQRADAIVDRIIQFQDTTADAKTYGQFPFFTDSKLGDQNVALFMAPYYFRELWPHQPRMTPTLAVRFRQSAYRLAEAAERRWDDEVFDIERDYKAYTNVFVMYINTLQLAGKYLRNDRLLRKAQTQWTRWFNHVSYYGIDEFTSPSYSNIDTENLLDIYDEATAPELKRQVKQVLDFLATQQYGISHPLLKLPICGSSRDYRNFQKSGNLEVDLVKGPLRGSYQPPARLAQPYATRQFPYEVTGRATQTPFRYNSYQTANGGMGSMTGGNYFWQQIHCMVAVGRSQQQREVAFLPGSFTPINGYVRQQANTALCVFSRSAATYHRTQARLADAAVPATFGEFGVGVTNGWQVVVNDASHLVLRAYGQEMHVYPFTLTDGNVMPIQLVYKKRSQISARGYHQRAADFGEYVFPEGVQWVGCWITYIPIGSQVVKPVLTYRTTDGIIRFQADKTLSVALFQQLTGELTELYEQDWRTMSLLKTPTETIWPGTLTQQAVSNQAAR